MPLLDEPYTISPPRTGDAVVSRLVLTGWSNGFASWTEDGRVYWDVVGSTLTLWNHSGRTGATTRLCSGTISAGVVTLSALNSSGISGTARVSYTADSTGDIIVSYAALIDMKKRCHSVASYLDGSNNWEGEPYFESALKDSKQELERWIPGKVDGAYRLKASNEFDYSLIAKPRQLAEVHANLALAVVFERLANISTDSMHFDMVDRYRRRAKEVFGTIRLDLNTGEDSVLEASASGGNTRLVRG